MKALPLFFWNDFHFLDRDVDDVADVMDDIQEGMDLANEVSEAISQPMGGAAYEDEDDLMAELDMMEEEAMAEQMLDVPAVSSLFPFL